MAKPKAPSLGTVHVGRHVTWIEVRVPVLFRPDGPRGLRGMVEQAEAALQNLRTVLSDLEAASREVGASVAVRPKPADEAEVHCGFSMQLGLAVDLEPWDWRAGDADRERALYQAISDVFEDAGYRMSRA